MKLIRGASSVDAVKPIQVSTAVGQESYEFLWKMKGFAENFRKEHMVSEQNFEIQTGKRSTLKTNWLIGKKFYNDSIGKHRFGVYFKLLRFSGSPSNLSVNVAVNLLKSDGSIEKSKAAIKVLKTGHEAIVEMDIIHRADWADWVDRDGAFCVVLKMTMFRKAVTHTSDSDNIDVEPSGKATGIGGAKHMQEKFTGYNYLQTCLFAKSKL